MIRIGQSATKIGDSMVEKIYPDKVWYVLNIDDRIKDYYEISTDGRIRNKNTLRLIKGEIDKYGYRRYTLQGYCKKVKLFAHRAVAKMFIEGDNTLEVNHKNANKLDNHVDNLEWVSNRENIRHSIDNKLQDFVKGSNHGCSIITEEVADIISRYIAVGYSNNELIDCLPDELISHITRQQLKSIVKHIRAKNSWRHISTHYF